VAVAKAQPPPDEYETDSEDDFSDREGESFFLNFFLSGYFIRANHHRGIAKQKFIVIKNFTHICLPLLRSTFQYIEGKF